MSLGGRFARRLAFAIAVFELFAAFGTGAVEAGALAQTVLLIATPFAVYGLLLPLLGRLFDWRAMRVLGIGGFALLVAVWGVGHRLRPLSLDGAMLVLAAALGALVLFAPAGRLDAALRRVPVVAAVIGAVAWSAWSLAPAPTWRGLRPDAAPPAAAPNLVLVSWDTVRADVLSLYGGAGLATPEADRLAAEGWLFEDAVAVASITGPSHASMLTGRYPPVHGLRSNGATAIADGVPTLAELLHEAGYRTAGFAAAYPMLGKFGFARGFESYDDRLPAGLALRVSKLGRRNFLWLAAVASLSDRAPAAALPGDEVNRRVADWLRGLDDDGDDRPFFLFVHYYDAHGPFTPPSPWREQALAAAGAAHPPAVEPGAARQMALYRAEIAQLDRLLGGLRAELERRDPGLRETLVLLTSDHGECFGEGGIVLNHTASLHEATQHVPLILRLPGAEGAGTRVAATATHLDILPTLLSAAAVPLPPDFGGPGKILTGLAGSRPAGVRRQVYMEAQQLHIGPQRKIGWRTGGRKLVRWLDGTEQLWGYGAGEIEGGDLRGAEPERFTALKQALDGFLARIEPAEGEFVEVDAVDLAALGALGYADD